MNFSQIISENNLRIAHNGKYYNPITGEGSVAVPRTKVQIQDAPLPVMFLPITMREVPLISSLINTGSMVRYLQSIGQPVTEETKALIWEQIIKVRIRYDFEYWAYMFTVIKAKAKGKDIPFYLNRAQRKLLRVMEHLRQDGKPINIILLKARQWGGSTLIQLYMLWLQLVHHEQWHSVICGDVEGQARNVRGMISKVLKQYPAWLFSYAQRELLGEKQRVKFIPFEGSQKNKQIIPTKAVVSIGSAQKPETLRSSDITMAHLTEVGMWQETPGRKPEDLVQSIFGTLYEGKDSLQVMESTAKGVGNYFHRTWQAAKAGQINMTPVFVAWFEIDIYSRPVDDYKAFITSMNEYEWELWNAGATLEAVNWYRYKSKGMEKWRMNSEFPSNDIEAFQSTGHRKFRLQDTTQLRKNCLIPEFKGDISADSETGKKSLSNIRFVSDERGALSVWAFPDTEIPVSDRYLVTVDIGGTSEAADYSVIMVLDRYMMMFGGVPEVVAEWHGHADHDLIAWKAVQMATLYGNALLVIESNTLETDETEGDNFEYILDEIAGHYYNLYSRTPADKIKQGAPIRWGFHTNKSTKNLVIAHQVKAVRDGLYIERCLAAVDEHDVFEIKENGMLGAVEGCHDDRLMTRAIGVYIAYEMPLPKEIKSTGKRKSCCKTIVSM